MTSLKTNVINSQSSPKTLSNGTGTEASFNGPIGIALDSSGNVYVSDNENHLIRKITSTGVVNTLAGTGSQGSENGEGTSASFYASTHSF
jgi:DNA-binding beta-propeller fold protein YncE